MLTILGSIVDMIKGIDNSVCDHLMSMTMLTLIMNKIFIQAPKIEAYDLGHNLDLLMYLANIVCSIF